VDLEPRAGDVDRLGMGGEASVGVVDVVADVAGAGDHVVGVVAGLVEVTVPELPLVDPPEQRLVAVDAVRTELVGEHGVHGVVHVRVVRRARAGDQRLFWPAR
jgi:hypothetical protein